MPQITDEQLLAKLKRVRTINASSPIKVNAIVDLMLDIIESKLGSNAGHLKLHLTEYADNDAALADGLEGGDAYTTNQTVKTALA